jgi:Transposase
MTPHTGFPGASPTWRDAVQVVAINDGIGELITLARTISRWAGEIVAAVLTGVSNAGSESLNRLAKVEARMAYSFRYPANQRRAVPTRLHPDRAANAGSRIAVITPGSQSATRPACNSGSAARR